MPAIEVSHLTKAFRTYKKQPGFAGAVKGLFRRKYEQTLAVKDVSFGIEPGELVGAGPWKFSARAARASIRRSEHILESELDDPRRQGRSDPSHGRGAHVAVRIVEIRVVEHIEELGSEVHALAFA